MTNKSDIIYAIIGFVTVVVIAVFCILSRPKYECPGTLDVLDGKQCQTEIVLKYNELKCTNNGYFNGKKCVQVTSSQNIDFNEVCSLTGEDIVKDGRVVTTEKFEKENNCGYKVTYVPKKNATCQAGYEFDETNSKCRTEKEKYALLDENKQHYCSQGETLRDGKCIYYEYIDPTITACEGEDKLSNNTCIREYIDETIVCSTGDYLDNACKILGSELYSICPQGYTDNGYSCSKKEIVDAIKK